MLELIRCIKKCDQGATAVEYGLIASLIVIAIIASLNDFATSTQVIWNDVSNKVVEGDQ